MNVYEFLSTHRSVLEAIQSLPAKPSDVKYIELYKDYVRLTEEGHKKVYILQYLSDEYKVDERTIYRVVKRLSEIVKL